MRKKETTISLLVFLLGIFIGAMDTGIVSPIRTIIADSFKISASLSVWVITIYTLTYAVSMPISGKLSDIYGKKKIYSLGITIFAIGSILCGISNFTGGFNLLLVARVIQAIGGGGIMPIATAYIGESFPIEKRGSALGLVGAVYGIATTLGPTIGSSLLTLTGTNNWGSLFFINVPICIVVIILAKFIKDDDVVKSSSKLDLKGSIFLSILILSIMYALSNLKFYDLKNSIQDINVWPFLLAFIIILPIFIFIEKKQVNPVLNLKYFTNRNIAITLILSFIVGCGLMGIVFLPQFGENVLKIKSGTGGYLVTLMAIFSGVAAPIGGKLIDKYSAKVILIIGFSSTIIGSLILALYTAKYCSIMSLIIGLAFMGLGMGFTMGTPLNYLMQCYVDKNETASAQSTLSLIRSIGVAISPNLLVNFISQAGSTMPNKIMNIMPKITMPNIPGMPHLSISGNSIGKISPDMVQKLQNADITTIVDTMKNFSKSIMSNMTPGIKSSLQSYGSNIAHGSNHININTIISNWQNNYLNSVDSSKSLIENVFQSTLNFGFSHLFITSALIAFIGFIFTLSLKNNKTI